MIKLQESMGPVRDRTCDPWICRQTRIYDIQTLKLERVLYTHFFLPTAIRGWNSLPATVYPVILLALSSTNCKRQKQPQNTVTAAIVHTRLRTNCSALNIDLLTRNVADSPPRNVADSLICRCGSIEDAQHLFLHFGYYIVQPNVLQNATSAPIVPSLMRFMFGDSTLSYECNSSFFKHVQNAKCFTLATPAHLS